MELWLGVIRLRKDVEGKWDRGRRHGKRQY